VKIYECLRWVNWSVIALTYVFVCIRLLKAITPEMQAPPMHSGMAVSQLTKV
jgi:hypothetical protein